MLSKKSVNFSILKFSGPTRQGNQTKVYDYKADALTTTLLKIFRNFTTEL